VQARSLIVAVIVVTWVVTIGIAVYVLRRSKVRRRASRYPTESDGRYRIAQDSWQPCRVIDISRTGASFESRRDVEDRPGAGTVHLELPAPSGSPEAIELAGEIRHWIRSGDGYVRIGIEFTGMSLCEQDMLDLMFRLHRVP
jgi:PilZ domain